MAGKVKLPEENVEYTFRLKNGGIVTYVYVGMNATGRVMLMTTKTKKFTTMTPGYFAYMRKNQLISRTPTEKYKKKAKKLLPPPTPFKTKKVVINEKYYIEEPEEINVSEELKKSCKALRELSPTLCQSILASVGMHPEDIAKGLEMLCSKPEGFYTQAFTNRVFGALIKAEDIIRLHEQSEEYIDTYI